MPILNMVYYAAEWGGWWQPWANTLFYLPLTEDTNDTSWNNRNATSSNVTFSSDGAYCRWGYWAWSNWTITTATFTMWTTYTINTWVKASEILSGDHLIDLHRRWAWPARHILFYVNTNWFTCLLWNGSNQNWNSITASFTMWTTWHNICLTRNWSNVYIYTDWQLLASWDGTYNVDPWYFYIGNDPSNISNYSWSSYIKDYIMESVIWTAQEISDYYNLTKSNYWL